MTDDQFQKLAMLYGFAPSRALRELVEAVERMKGGAFAQTLQDRLDEALEQRGALLEALKEIHQATMRNGIVLAKCVGINAVAGMAIAKAEGEKI